MVTTCYHKPSFSLKLRGECLEKYISDAQDVTKNAQSKSLQAAYNCWVQQLKADQVCFESELLSNHGCYNERLFASFVMFLDMFTKKNN